MRAAASLILGLGIVAAAPAGAAGWHWSLHGELLGLDPGNGAIRESSQRGDGTVERSRFALEPGGGFALGVEARRGDRFGVAVDALYGDLDATFALELGDRSDRDTARVGFMALVLGPNFHIEAGRRIELFLGPRLGFVDLGDGLGDLVHDESPALFQVLGEVHTRELGDSLFLGAELGFQAPLSAGAWALQGSVRYLHVNTSAEDGDLQLGAFSLGLGVACHFSGG